MPGNCRALLAGDVFAALLRDLARLLGALLTRDCEASLARNPHRNRFALLPIHRAALLSWHRAERLKSWREKDCWRSQFGSHTHIHKVPALLPWDRVALLSRHLALHRATLLAGNRGALLRRHALTLRPRYLFALLGGGAIAETDHGDESLEVFYSGTHLHCWRGTVWHCCLGTCWHCCLGTCSHCCLGTCWHCCRGSSEHCCRGTVWHCCLDTGSQTWFKDIFHPGFQFFNLTSRW